MSRIVSGRFASRSLSAVVSSNDHTAICSVACSVRLKPGAVANPGQSGRRYNLNVVIGSITSHYKLLRKLGHFVGCETPSARVPKARSGVLNKCWAIGVLLLLPSASALAASAVPPVLADTSPLEWQDDIDVRLMDGAHRFVGRKINESLEARGARWSREFTTPAAYEKSIAPNRERFRKSIGLVDDRLPARLERFGSDDSPVLIADADGYTVYQVRWDVVEGVHGEGLLLRPTSAPVGFVVALSDADQTPEQIAGLASGVAVESQFARKLVERGFEVLVPTLVDRGSQWAGHPEFPKTDQTHREWIYRQAFQMGRHIIGHEVQKALAGVDWFSKRNPDNANIGVVGYGEGGLLALYAAAVDTRIQAALVSGYFTSRQSVWQEPIYRNVWGLLHEFGDAEIASLLAPHGLVVEHSKAPRVTGHKGAVDTPNFAAVRDEFDRIDGLTGSIRQPKRLIAGPGGETVPFGSHGAIDAFAKMLGWSTELGPVASPPPDRRKAFDAGARQSRQVREIEGHLQKLIRQSEHVRDRRFLHKLAPVLADRTWTKRLRHDTVSPEAFVAGAEEQRQYFRDEVIGNFDDPLRPPNARTRKIYDNDKFAGYDVVLDVWPDVIAWGILLVPKDIQPGERRPVVVCQHGRQGVPRETVEGDTDYYHDFAARLAERGFITFSPHNLYRGEDRYRWLDRKANSVKASMFSFILAQHEQILNWLGTLPFVDADRIAFYGLSYGGETAVRVPTILEGYALSICSGDFNNWTRKVAATDQVFSFMYTIEWEMPYFDMGSTFDYAEMAYLMVPRPFMVERGHHDRVGRDRWVAHEYAKVRLLYNHLGIGDRTEIEYFNGGHTIWGRAAFDFLHKHLNWPKR